MAPVEHPTASWRATQDGSVFYRRQQCYAVSGRLPDLGQYVVAGCRYGGPIAIMRDAAKFVVLGDGQYSFSKSEIGIYSSTGEGMLLFRWSQATVVKFGWTYDERLAVLTEEGIYRLYDLQGDYRQYSFGAEAAENGIIDARIHENGIVAMTGALTLLEIKGWNGEKPQTLADTTLTEPPHSWTVIPPNQTISGHAAVLLSADATVLSVDCVECTDQRISKGPFTHLAASPNGKSLALLTMAGLLWVVSTDFHRNLAEYDTAQAVTMGMHDSPTQVEWCGNDAVLVCWSRSVLLVGPFGATLNGVTHAISEIDGVRILGSDSCDFIQKVPLSSVLIFRPGSTSPSAILYDALQHFSRRSPKAEENIRSIRPELASAVDDCIDAAGQEWEPYWQRRLLNAAQFGRAFLDLQNPSDFVHMGQTLKVLNAVRLSNIGIPLTHAQFSYTSPSHLINRLTSRSLHLLAHRISTFLALNVDPVLKRWAYAKVTKSKTAPDTPSADDELCRAIRDKFKSVSLVEVSYAEIATRAWEVGRPGLATNLLNYEALAAHQVPLLLNMKEDRIALIRAVKSGDTDLVYHVLLHLHRELPLGAFFRLIEDAGPSLASAAKLLEKYAREQNRDMLREFYYYDDRRTDSAVLSLQDAVKATTSSAKIVSVKAAHDFFLEDKERSFEAKMTGETLRLLALQHELEEEMEGRVSFSGQTLHETLTTCLTNGLVTRVEKLKSDFKVSDKRYWYIKLHALTLTQDWDGLDAFSHSKRSPIGLETFVRHILEKGHAKEACAYVWRCDSGRRADLYAQCGEWILAGKECKERRDRVKLTELIRRSPNNGIARDLERILSTMQ